MNRAGRNGGRGRGGGHASRTQSNAGTEVRSSRMVADGSYNLPETWRTLSLWCGENGCELIKAMFQAEDAEYPKFDDRYGPV